MLRDDRSRNSAQISDEADNDNDATLRIFSINSY